MLSHLMHGSLSTRVCPSHDISIGSAVLQGSPAYPTQTYRRTHGPCHAINSAVRAMRPKNEWTRMPTHDETTINQVTQLIDVTGA